MVRKNKLIQAKVTEKEKNLIEDSLYKNGINIKFIQSGEPEEIKKYLAKKIEEGKEKFLKPSEEAFWYWNSLKTFLDDNFDKENLEIKSLYWKILLNWELNRNRELYEELSML
ncbi:hypothetical protein [Clostridium sp.]|uniref:hypothetical protein n=1 Tax=Clostridium sp. TaxID=1506 RepID=UPI002FC69413